MVGPAIGLPTLAVVDCANVDSGWKFDAVARHAGQRPLVWLDDDFDLYPAAGTRSCPGGETRSPVWCGSIRALGSPTLISRPSATT